MSLGDAVSYPELDFEENTFSFIAGKSGCGKSTYLRMLNRTVLPTEGHIIYDGSEAGTYPVLEYRRSVLLVPQEVFLFDGSIRDNFRRYADVRGTEPASDEEMRSLMKVCCADFDLGTDCRNLSVGERQRVFLSVFLSFMPRVLMLDEPTAALDEKTAFNVLSNIKVFCRENGITVICVCHSETLIDGFADTAVRLEASE